MMLALLLVFMPDPAAGAPVVVVSVDDVGAHRELSWAVAGKAAGTFSDEQAGRGFSTLPSPPKGSTLIERDGTISVTIDDAGKWQEALKGQAKLPALPLPSATSLRLVVDPSGAAVLYGADVRIAGRAIVKRDEAPVRAVVLAGKDLIEGSGVAVDEVAGCGRTVPSTVSVVGAASLKLSGSGPAVCAGPLAVIPVSGVKLDAKKDVPAAGVVIAR